MISKPWIRVDSSLNRCVLDQFVCCVLLYIFDNPGVQFLGVSNKFRPALAHVWILEILEILLDMKCIISYHLDSSNSIVREATSEGKIFRIILF